jgi:sec-independent protein translocase protein TatC
LDSDKPRPLLEHLEELRLRIIYSIIYLVLGSIAGFFITDWFLFRLLLTPIASIPGISLQVLGPTDKLMAYFRASFIAGVALAVPFIMHQVWLFLRPGLRRSERRLLAGLVPTSLILFVAGAAFVFFVLIPPALMFLNRFLPDTGGVRIETRLSLDQYFAFVLYLVLAGGLVFQMPLITWFLARLGVVTYKWMARNRKFAILGAAILGAVVTPTGDPFNMALLSVPIYALYEISIAVAALAGRR